VFVATTVPRHKAYTTLGLFVMYTHLKCIYGVVKPFLHVSVYVNDYCIRPCTIMDYGDDQYLLPALRLLEAPDVDRRDRRTDGRTPAVTKTLHRVPCGQS